MEGGEDEVAAITHLLGNTGSGSVVVGGVIAAAYFLHKMWLSVKSDRIESNAASRIDEANRVLVEQLREEINRLHSLVREYREQMLECEVEMRRVRASNEKLMVEVNALRTAAGLPHIETKESTNDYEII